MHGAPLYYDGDLYPRDYYMHDDYDEDTPIGPKPNLADDRPRMPTLVDDRAWNTKNGQRWFGVVKDIVSGIAKGIPLISHSMNIGKMIDNGWGSGWFG